MTIHSVRRIILASLVAGSLVAGCARYRAYQGPPRAFSTHPYRLIYPAAFTHVELPQMSREQIVLAVFTRSRPGAMPAIPTMPAIIAVRADRMREQETLKTFMERYYDDVAPKFLDIAMRQVGDRPGAPEWAVTAESGYFAARVIVLPRERLAYGIVTQCSPAERSRFEQAFRRARASFQVLPARR